MPNLINITVDDSDALFKAPEYKFLPAGVHLFLVGNGPLAVEVVESSGNDIIKLQARCQDDDENKGTVVFHNFVFIKDPQTDGQRKSVEINNAQLAQFTAACGIATVDEIKAGTKFDLDDFTAETFFRAETVVKNENVFPEELDEDGKPKKAPKASIKRFLFEPVKE